MSRHTIVCPLTRYAVIVHWWRCRETSGRAGFAVVARDLSLVEALCTSAVLQSRLPAGASTRYAIEVSS